MSHLNSRKIQLTGLLGHSKLSLWRGWADTDGTKISIVFLNGDLYISYLSLHVTVLRLGRLKQRLLLTFH